MLTNRRSFFVKCFVIVCVLYLGVYMYKTNSTSDIIRELQQSGRNLAALDTGELENPAPNEEEMKEPAALASVPSTKKAPTNLQSEVKSNSTDMAVADSPKESVFDKVKKVTNCLDKPFLHKTQQRGDYWVLYNYVSAERRHKCHESITYTTHADFSFMDNLVPLSEHWQGPISIALHAPGTDFKYTIDSIAYLRECTSPVVKELVTFHIYFSTKHVPKEVCKSYRLASKPLIRPISMNSLICTFPGTSLRQIVYGPV